jgi:type VI secretion system protein ImpM
VFASAPAWNCAIPACVSGGSTLIGLLAPSHDQVGREFPLCAGVALPPEADSGPLLADAHGWMWTLGKLVTEARERGLPLDVFDAAVQAIPLPLSVSDPATVGGEGDIFSVLGLGPADVPTIPMPLAQAVPWPGLPALFDPQTPTSFWWTNPGAGGPLRGFSTEGPLAPSLLVTLMRPPAPPKGPPLFS